MRRLAGSEVAVAGAGDVSVGGLAGQAGGARLSAGTGAALAFGERTLSLESGNVSHLVDINCNRNNHRDAKQAQCCLEITIDTISVMPSLAGQYASHWCYVENRRDKRL